MRLIFEDDTLHVSGTECNGDTITLCFTGVGNLVGDIDVQSPEFVRVSNNSTALFIIDKRRSWGNDIDFSIIQDIVASCGGEKKINVIGNSMGGFLAVLATTFCPVRVCVAFVPQFSVCNEIVPSETRWRQWVDPIISFKHIDLSSSFNDETLYYIVSAVGGDDDAQLSMFPDKENIRKIFFTDKEMLHYVAQTLKRQGLLYELLGGCLSGASASEIIDAHLRGTTAFDGSRR